MPSGLWVPAGVVIGYYFYAILDTEYAMLVGLLLGVILRCSLAPKASRPSRFWLITGWLSLFWVIITVWIEWL